MNVLHVHNAGSQPFHYCRMLRRKDVDADLFTAEYHLQCHPLWEIVDTDVEEIQKHDNQKNNDTRFYPRQWIESHRDRVPDWVDLLPQECEGDPTENFTSPAFNFKVISKLRKKDPDLIHAWSLYGAVWASFSGHRYVYYNTGLYDWNTVRRMDPSPKKYLFRPVVNRAIRNAEFVLSEPRQGEKISDAYPEVDVRTPRQVIDTEYFSPQEAEAPYLGDTDELLLFMGSRQFWESKHNDYLFRALAEADLTDYRLVCADWGVDIKRAKNLVRELDIQDKVTWVPMMSRPRLRRMINASDIVFDAFERGFGTFATQTLSCGKPLVSAFNFSEEHLNQQDSGYDWDSKPPIVEAYSPEDIIERVQELTDPRRREERGRKSREWIEENYNWEDGIQDHIDIYEDVLN